MCKKGNKCDVNKLKLKGQKKRKLHFTNNIDCITLAVKFSISLRQNVYNFYCEVPKTGSQPQLRSASYISKIINY